MWPMVSMFRCIEALVALASLAWISLHLPLAFRHTTAFFSHLAAILFSPSFVFLIGNAIIVTLIAMSGGHLNAQTSPPAAGYFFPSSNLHDELLRNGERRATNVPAKEEDEEDFVCLDKPTVYVESSHKGKESAMSTDSQLTPAAGDKRECCRTRSGVMVVGQKNAEQQQYDSDTSLCRRVKGSAAPTQSYSESEMSNEEFRMAIESFIARQLIKFQKEAELCPLFLMSLQ